MPDVGAEQRPLREGRYRLLKPLGEGGMAVVWLAHDERLGVTRAVKVLNASLASSASIRRRFEAEARTMARLHHRHIVTVHDVDSDGDVTFIVMELVDGGSLWDRVRSAGPLPPRLVCEVTADLLGALEVAHQDGVIHRDVKPHNALIARDGTIKLSDFGIAQVSGEKSGTRTGSIMGTLAYMAPEQRTDAKHVGPTADLYAVGGTIYAIATGKDPIDLHSDQARAEQLEALPEPLRALVDRACRYKPDERWQSAAEMRAAVLAAIPSLPETPAETPPLVTPKAAPPPPTGAGVTVDVSRLDAAPREITLGDVAAPKPPEAREGTLASVPTLAPVDRRPLWLGVGLAGFAAAFTLTIGVIVAGAWMLQGPTEAPPPVLAPDPVVLAPPPEPPPAAPVEVVAPPIPIDVVAPPIAPVRRPATLLAETPAPPAPALVPTTPDLGTAAEVPLPPAPPPEPAVDTVRLFVNAKPPALVTIDGAERGRTPVTAQVPPGSHVVTVRSDGGEPVSRTLDAAAPKGASFCWDFNVGAVCTR